MSEKSINRHIAQIEKRVGALELGQIRKNAVEADTAKQQPRDESGPAPSVPAVIENATSNTENSRSKDEKSNPWWKEALKTIGIVSGVVYAVVTYVQWHDLRRNFEVEQRAWIKLGYQWPQLSSVQPAIMNGTLINFGKSTVTYLYAHGVLEVVPEESSPSFNFHQPGNKQYDIPVFPSDSINFPMRLFDRQTAKERPFTAQEIDDLQHGRSYIAAFGWVIYRDQFGAHWYRFCSWTGYGAGDANAAECLSWNRIGDGQPDKKLLPK